MTASSEVFERNYQGYRSQLAQVDFDAIEPIIGIERDGERMTIPFLDRRYRVSADGIVDEAGNRPDYMIFVILAQYILRCPERLHHDPDWVSFKDFKRATHFTNVNYFTSDTERALEKRFSGNPGDLAQACRSLGGTPTDMGRSFDLSVQFTALPRIPLLLLFNDADEDFPAKCTVLLPKHAEFYLDPESLAMTCAVLSKRLAAQGPA